MRWVPSSHTLFLASYADGSIVIYDKEREDGTFTPQDPNKRAQASGALATADESLTTSSNLSTAAPTSSDPHSKSGEWDPTEEMFVSMPPWHPSSPAAVLNRESAGNNVKTGKNEKAGKNEKTGKNPITHWKLSRRGIVGKRVGL